ncbi:MAG: hypothetical protein LQ344_003722 [Seirophora lacunosa]|nr:MAG: hypothetical protein LQ344_003722 [Seirophora lacunosa]
MVLKVNDITLYNVSVTLISCTTLMVAISIFSLFMKTQRRRAGERPTVACWFYAHRMQKWLALSNLLEIVVLLTIFPLVSIDREYLCHTELPTESCQSLINTWGLVAACLFGAGVFSAVSCIVEQASLKQRATIRRNRSHDMLNNRPWALAAAHYLLQVSALATVFAALSPLFFQDPQNPRAALITSFVTGAIAVLFFLSGVVATCWGITKYHYTMRSLRQEARERQLLWAAEVNWGIGVEERLKLFWGASRADRTQERVERDLEVLLEAVAWRMRGEENDVWFVALDGYD